MYMCSTYIDLHTCIINYKRYLLPKKRKIPSVIVGVILSVLFYFRQKYYFRPYIFIPFSLWSLLFIFIAFSSQNQKSFHFGPYHHLTSHYHHLTNGKKPTWQMECTVGILKVDVAIKIIIKNVIWH